MSELLPIVFQRGQNEGIDPRVAPETVHATARNVRWRKDGRPAKRYGSVVVDTSGFEQSSSRYLTQPANAICSWLGQPLFACGGGVATLSGGIWGKRAPQGPVPAVELAHWGPGLRTTIAQPEAYVLNNLSVGNGANIVLFAWDDGASIYLCARTRDGGLVVQPAAIVSGTSPRIITSTANSGRYIYVLYKLSTNLQLAIFDTSTLTTSFVGVATLGSAAYTFDGLTRGGDFVIAYQLSATQVRVQLMAASAAPAATQTQTLAIASTTAGLVGVAGNSTSNVFVAVVQDVASGGSVFAAQYNNTLTAAVLASTTLDTDIHNLDPPSIMIESNATAFVVWGGGNSSTPTAYMRTRLINASGVAAAAVSYLGLRPASKPFAGPEFAALGTSDSRYIWAHTAQTTDNTSWLDQRGYLLVQFGLPGAAPRRHLHVPNVNCSAAPSQAHLADVFDGGAGYGFSVALPSVIRDSTPVSAAESYGAEWVTFRSIYESQRMAARDTAFAGGAVQFSGGSLMEWNGSIEETGFSSFPVILNAIAGAGGSLSAGSYIYRVVYEWLDGQGRRHRSEPSDPVSVTVTAAQRVTLTFQLMVAESRLNQGGVTAHVYRTLAGQGTFHRVTPNSGAPVGSPSTANYSFSYADLAADASAAFGEILYTDGGVLGNDTPPPSTFMCVCNGRLWLGGQLDANVITASKILVDSEPTQFSAEAEFSVFLPSACTGLASIDGTVVAFARDRIYLITGDGPNDQGVGSFSPPTELPTDTGCIDWRSIVETSQGVFFQGKRGIYLLPRGFNTPVFVGAEVESTLAAYPIVQSATLVTQPSSGVNFLGENTVRFTVGNAESSTIGSVVLVYDLRTGGWSVDVIATFGTFPGIGGTWNDAFVYVLQGGGNFAGLRAESVGTYDDFGSPSAFIPTTLGTGDVRPFGVGGYGGFDSVLVVGEYRGDSIVTVSVSVDGAAADLFSFVILSSDADIGADGSVYLDVTPRVRLGSAIRVTVTDSAKAAFAVSEGFIAQALFIEHDTIGKTKRLAAARRA